MALIKLGTCINGKSQWNFIKLLHVLRTSFNKLNKILYHIKGKSWLDYLKLVHVLKPNLTEIKSTWNMY